MILVIGATGMLGSEICLKIKDRGHDVRALVRNNSDPVRVQLLRESDIKAVKGDLHDPQCYDRILNGIATIVVTASAVPNAYHPEINNTLNFDHDAIMRFLGYAQSVGVKRVIYTSFSGNIDLKFPLRNAKRTVETFLQESDMIYTILRPSAFMEVWLSPALGFDPWQGKAEVYGNGRNPVSYISIHNVANFAVESLTNPFARKATLELGGPAAVSQLDAVHIFEKQLGTKVDIQFHPEAELQEAFSRASNDLEASFAGLQLSIARGDKIDMKSTLDKFIIQMIPVEEYAKKAMAVH